MDYGPIWQFPKFSSLQIGNDAFRKWSCKLLQTTMEKKKLFHIIIMPLYVGDWFKQSYKIKYCRQSSNKAQQKDNRYESGQATMFQIMAQSKEQESNPWWFILLELHGPMNFDYDLMVFCQSTIILEQRKKISQRTQRKKFRRKERDSCIHAGIFDQISESQKIL